MPSPNRFNIDLVASIESTVTEYRSIGSHASSIVGRHDSPRAYGGNTSISISENDTVFLCLCLLPVCGVMEEGDSGFVDTGDDGDDTDVKGGGADDLASLSCSSLGIAHCCVAFLKNFDDDCSQTDVDAYPSLFFPGLLNIRDDQYSQRVGIMVERSRINQSWISYNSQDDDRTPSSCLS